MLHFIAPHHDTMALYLHLSLMPKAIASRELKAPHGLVVSSLQTFRKIKIDSYLLTSYLHRPVERT